MAPGTIRDHYGGQEVGLWFGGLPQPTARCVGTGGLEYDLSYACISEHVHM